MCVRVFMLMLILRSSFFHLISILYTNLDKLRQRQSVDAVKMTQFHFKSKIEWNERNNVHTDIHTKQISIDSIWWIVEFTDGNVENFCGILAHWHGKKREEKDRSRKYTHKQKVWRLVLDGNTFARIENSLKISFSSIKMKREKK